MLLLVNRLLLGVVVVGGGSGYWKVVVWSACGCCCLECLVLFGVEYVLVSVIGVNLKADVVVCKPC